MLASFSSTLISFGMRENGVLVLRDSCAAGVDEDFLASFPLVLAAFALGSAAESLDEVSISELAGETFLGPSESVALVSELTRGLFLLLSEDESLSDSDEESDSEDAGRGVFLAIELLDGSDSEPELEPEEDSLEDCPASLVAGLLTEF